MDRRRGKLLECKSIRWVHNRGASSYYKGVGTKRRGKLEEEKIYGDARRCENIENVGKIKKIIYRYALSKLYWKTHLALFYEQPST